jgi:8-oxo-dGTP pyrophosphatase MutT (NUDIX family)
VDQIQKSVDEMSVVEKERLKTESFDKLWKMLWGDNNGIQYRGEEVASSKKFEIIRNGVQSDTRTIGDTNVKTSADSKVTLSDIIQNSKTSWEETEWEFPKGRRNFQEKDLECALREFEEETGYSSKDIIVIENLLPFEEIFIGSNHKSYKHKYFLAYMNETVDNLQNYQKTEVSKMEWKTIDQCLEAIRPYNLEKKQLITNINKVLQEYRLYS